MANKKAMNHSDDKNSVSNASVFDAVDSTMNVAIAPTKKWIELKGCPKAIVLTIPFSVDAHRDKMMSKIRKSIKDVVKQFKEPARVALKELRKEAKQAKKTKAKEVPKQGS